MLKRIATTYKWDILIHRLVRHERHDVFVGLFYKNWSPVSDWEKANLPFLSYIQFKYNNIKSRMYFMYFTLLYFFLFESIGWTAYQTLWTNSAVSLSHLLVIIVTALDYWMASNWIAAKKWYIHYIGVYLFKALSHAYPLICQNEKCV